MINVSWFANTDIQKFPDPKQALREPDGLLAIGGNLSPQTLENAYRNGIFPWYEDGQPIMWWSPSIRAVIPTAAIHVSRNMQKMIKQHRYQVRADGRFHDVVAACASRAVTWISKDMQAAYLQLHHAGIAHSIEVYDKNENLVGGLYGVFVKNCFCGESMFSLQSNTSKLALIILARFLHENGCSLIDCQLPTQHLLRLGAINWPQATFIEKLRTMPDNFLLSNKKWVTIWAS